MGQIEKLSINAFMVARMAWNTRREHTTPCPRQSATEDLPLKLPHPTVEAANVHRATFGEKSRSPHRADPHLKAVTAKHGWRDNYSAHRHMTRENVISWRAGAR